MTIEAKSLSEKIKLFEEAQQRLATAERRISILQEENEILEIALNELLRYYTVSQYNKAFHKGWDAMKSQDVERNLFTYCRSRAIKVRKCETNDERFGSVNSYPITVWNEFLEKFGA
jgi:hypothetical protein